MFGFPSSHNECATKIHNIHVWAFIVQAVSKTFGQANPLTIDIFYFFIFYFFYFIFFFA